MIYLSEQTLSKLNKAELLKYSIDLTQYAKTNVKTPEYEFIHTAKQTVLIDSNKVGTSFSIKVKVINDDVEEVHTITIKIMSNSTIQFTSHEMKDLINIDNALAGIINSHGLTKSTSVYLITQYIKLSTKFCFIEI